ncbi:YcaO-like family protein [Mesorhizobium sp. IMUNJ 23232]|uniref:YcaO-like family protein n=1 Tax=Mesorhizobium sp. IMUNJ 23232 TaxID=3376064 RepID=UPI00379486AF
MTIEQARASCMGEAAELASACFWGNEARVRATYGEVAPSGVHPASLLLLSEDQYRQRQASNAAHGVVDWIPTRFDEALPVDWVAANSPDGEDRALVPAACVYIGYFEVGDEGAFAVADSNGCATGATLDDATATAFLELVERDATAIWWYGRHVCPNFNLGAVDGEEKLVASLEARSRSFHLLDLTTDLRIPVCAAVSAEPGGGAVAVGVAAHFDASRAAIAALTEMLQVEFSIAVRCRMAPVDDSDRLGFWLRRVSLHSMPHLQPSGESSVPPSGTGPAGVAECLRVCREAGLRLLAVDLTRPEIGVPAVRVIVPGLRPLQRRLAAGRLFDVPVSLGWRDAPMAPEELNPIPMSA